MTKASENFIGDVSKSFEGLLFEDDEVVKERSDATAKNNKNPPSRDPNSMPAIAQPYRPPESAPFLEDYVYTPMLNNCESIRILCL
jgi:hypothetical protein